MKLAPPRVLSMFPLLVLTAEEVDVTDREVEVQRVLIGTSRHTRTHQGHTRARQGTSSGRIRTQAVIETWALQLACLGSTQFCLFAMCLVDSQHQREPHFSHLHHK